MMSKAFRFQRHLVELISPWRSLGNQLLNKYLQLYAEPEARGLRWSALAAAIEKPWRRVMVIPVYHDLAMLRGLIASVNAAAVNYDGRLGLIVVVNAKTGDDERVLQTSQDTLEFFKCHARNV